MAVLGKTGSGKTSVVKAAIVEPALSADERVCVIDPTGAWWGLRLKADGRTKGYPVYVFGGRHADYPLLGTHGEAMADVIGTTNTPAILDTSLMKTGERMKFFTDFADALLRKNEGPLRLVIDEAHIFMPQAGTRGSGAMPEMLHAGNNLISLGRSRGLRIVLLSQRAAKLHKDSLTQVETLLALRLIAPQDRGAVREWIADQADLEKGKEIIASLPKLAAGEAWAWSPEADFLKRLQFPLPETYDSSAAPTSSGKSKRLSPIDLDKLKDRLAKVDAVAKDNDPKLLRAEVAKLKGELSALEKKAATAAPAKPTKDAVAAAETRGIDKGQKAAVAAAEKTIKSLRTALEAAMKFIVEINAKGFFKAGGEAVDKKAVEKGLSDAMAHMTKLIEQHLGRRDKQIDALRAEAERVIGKLNAVLEQDVTLKVDVVHNEPFTIAATARPGRSLPRPAPPSRVTSADGDGTYTGPQIKIFRALAMWRALGHEAPTREMVAAIAGYPPSSGAFKNPLGALNATGAVCYPVPGHITLQVAELDTISADEGRSILVSNFGGPQRKIVGSLVDRGTRTREEIAADAGYPVSSGAFKNPLGALRTLGVVDYPKAGEVCLSDWAQELLTGCAERLAA
jgi:hypothetical protein